MYKKNTCHDCGGEIIEHAAEVNHDGKILNFCSLNCLYFFLDGIFTDKKAKIKNAWEALVEIEKIARDGKEPEWQDGQSKTGIPTVMDVWRLVSEFKKHQMVYTRYDEFESNLRKMANMARMLSDDNDKLRKYLGVPMVAGEVPTLEKLLGLIPKEFH